METPHVPSILPPGISHPAKRSCTQNTADNSAAGPGRRGNMPQHNLKLPHPPSGPPPSGPPPPDSGRRGYTPGRHDHMITPRGGWQSPRTPRGGWQGIPNARSNGRVTGLSHKGDAKQNVPFVPSEGDMKIQLSSTTMAWVDRRGNILHSWKRTKRGTRGGKNRRQDDSHAAGTPRGAREQTPRAQAGGLPPVTPEAQEQVSKESATKQAVRTPPAASHHHNVSQQDSDCSSTCELHDGSHIEVSRTPTLSTPTAAGAHTRQSSQVSGEVVGDLDDFGADEMLMPDPSSTSPNEMAELITRLYGLVNVLQNDNEQLRKTCAEIQLNSSSSDGEVAQLKQKLQQVTSERDLLQQQVLFQH